MNIIIYILAAAALVAFSAPPSSADLLGDTLKPFVSVTEIYDGNIFRVKDRAQLEELIESEKMGDFLTVASLGTEVHYEVSRQKLDLLVMHDFIRYSHYSNLDTDRDLARGTISLALYDKIRLKLDGSYEDYPQPRTDFRSNRLNKVTKWSAGGTASYEMTSGVGFEGGYSHSDVDYSLESYTSRQYTVDRYTGKITYNLSPMTRVYAGYQRDEIDYPRPIKEAGDFSNVADSVRLGIDVTKLAKTTLSGYAGFVTRKHLHLADRDFEGFISQLAVTYSATPKLGVKLDWQRQIYEETYKDWMYSITNALSGSITYQVTPKVRFATTGEVEWKDFENVAGVNSARREDFLYEGGFNVEWEIYRRLALGIGYLYSGRSSNYNYDFTDHTATATLAYRY